MALLTALDIVNAACARIGVEPLQSLGEEVTAGQAASFIYEETVDFNLSLEPFSWAHEIRPLSRLASTLDANGQVVPQTSGWLYAFDIPGSTLGPPVWLTDDPTDPDRRFTAYKLVSGRVHADAEALWAHVKFRPDPHRWPAAFRSATIAALGASLALSIASDRNSYDRLYGEAYGTPSENNRGGKMRNAIFEDAYATPARRINWRGNPLERAWRGGE